jgi:hypothetical protein
MQEIYAEIRGTLARTADKKNTTLYRLHRQQVKQDRAEKFGFAERPKYPSEATTVPSAKHFLNDISNEIGQKISRLSNPGLHSLVKDGEEAIRALNLDINRLARQKEKWNARVLQLQAAEAVAKAASRRGGHGAEAAAAAAAATAAPPPAAAWVPFAFFGCAKELPEAIEEAAKAKRKSDEAQRQHALKLARRENRKRNRAGTHSDDDDSIGGGESYRGNEEDDDSIVENPFWAAAKQQQLIVPSSAGASPLQGYLEQIQRGIRAAAGAGAGAVDGVTDSVNTSLAAPAAATTSVAASPVVGGALGLFGYITDFTATDGRDATAPPTLSAAASSGCHYSRLLPVRTPEAMKALLFQRKKELLMRQAAARLAK